MFGGNISDLEVEKDYHKDPQILIGYKLTKIMYSESDYGDTIDLIFEKKDEETGKTLYFREKIKEKGKAEYSWQQVAHILMATGYTTEEIIAMTTASDFQDFAKKLAAVPLKDTLIDLKVVGNVYEEKNIRYAKLPKFIGTGFAAKTGLNTLKFSKKEEEGNMKYANFNPLKPTDTAEGAANLPFG